MPRIVVNPGDPVISSWGNTVFDQSVQSFTNPAQRDAQWPTPLAGAMSYTTDTNTLWVRRAGQWKALPLGYQTSAVGPGSQVNAPAALTTVMSLTFGVTVGRRYRINAFGRGIQQTAAGNPQFAIADDQSVIKTIVNVTGLPSGSTLLGSGYLLYTPTSTKTALINLQASGGAGTLQITANQCDMVAEDIGF